MANELNKEDLSKVVGGRLTAEASAWLNKYESKLMALAREKGLEDDLRSGLGFAKLPIGTPFTLDELKSILSGFIDISQFN